MKRLIRVVALFMVFVSIFTCLASASEVNGPYMSIIDYQNSRAGQVTSANPYFDLEMPYMACFYIDIVITVSGTFTGVYDEKSGSSSPLNVVNLGANTYRLYGSTHGGWRDQIRLHFTGVSGILYVTLVSADVSALSLSRFDSLSYFSLTYQSASTTSYTLQGSMTSVNTPYSSSYFGDVVDENESGYMIPYPFQVYVSDSNWRKYDFLDLHFRINCHSIDSLSCTVGDLKVPAEISLFTSSATSSVPTRIYFSNEFGSDASVYEYFWGTELVNHTIDIIVRLDLRSVDRTKNYYPKVDVRGLMTNTGDNRITLVNSIGSIEYDETNILVTLIRAILQSQSAYHSDIQAWQQAHDQLLIDKFDIIVQSIADQTSSIRTGLTNLQSAVINKLSAFQLSTETWFTTISNQLDELIHPDTSDSEQFEDDIASQATEMEDISETLDSVTKPPVDDFDVSIDDYFEGQDTVAFASPLSAFFDNSIFIVMFLMSMVAVTVSYVFYGKR